MCVNIIIIIIIIIYKKHIIIYIYNYDENFSQLYDKCGARAARQLLREGGWSLGKYNCKCAAGRRLGRGLGARA